MVVDNSFMHEMMIDVFLDLQGDDLEGKDVKDVLMSWVSWIDARYKVAVIPDICYAIVDCESGEVVSMINADFPNAKEQAKSMCASLNCVPVPEDQPEKSDADDLLKAQDVANAFLDMDEDGFMDFLLSHISQEKEE